MQWVGHRTGLNMSRTHRFLLCLIQNAHHISAAVLRGSLLITSGAENRQKSKRTQINTVSQTTTPQLTTFLWKKSFRNWMFGSWLIQLGLGALLWGVCLFATFAHTQMFLFIYFSSSINKKKAGRQEGEVNVTKCVLFRGDMNQPENLIWRAEKSTGS